MSLLLEGVMIYMSPHPNIKRADTGCIAREEGRKEGGSVLAAKDKLNDTARYGSQTGKPVQDPHFVVELSYATPISPSTSPPLFI